MIPLMIPLTLLLALSVPPSAEGRAEDSNRMTYEYIPNLLRMNRQGKTISSDLSEYVSYSCRYENADSSSKTCSVDIDEQDFRDALDTEATDPADDSIVSYLEGVAMYAFLNMVGFVLLVLSVAVYLIYYLISCCCSCSTARPIKSPPMWRFFTAYGCMLFTVLFLCVVAILGHSLGGSQLTEGIVSASDSTSGVSNMIKSSAYPAQQLVVNSLATAVVPALMALNSTVFGAIDVGGLCNDTAAVNDLFNELNIVPYVRETFDDLARRGTAIVDETKAEVDNIMADVDALETQARDILGSLEEANESLMNMTSVLEESLPLLEDLNSENKRLSGPSAETGPSGLVGSVLSDLATISRDETAPGGFGFPLAATYGSAASGSLVSVESLQPGGGNSLNGSSANIDLLNDKLQFIYDRMLLLPDYGETGDNLVEINNTLKRLLGEGGLLDQLAEKTDRIVFYQSLVPSADSVNADVSDFFDAAEALSFDELKDLVDEVGDYIDDVLEPFRYIRSKIQGIDINALIPPLYHLMVVQADIVSQKLFDLDGLYNSTEDYLPLQKQITDNSDVLDDVVDALNDAIDAIKLVNVTDYLITITDFERSINETLNSVDEDELHSIIDNFADIAKNVNASKYVSELAAVRTAMEAVLIPDATSVLPALNLLEVEKNATIAALKRAIGTDITVPAVSGTRDGDYRLLAMGVCTDDSDVYCSDDADCVGTCHHQGIYRCAGNGLNAIVTFCSSDGDCGANSYCLNDNARTAALRVRLEIFAVDTLLDDTTSQTGAISGLDTYSITSVFNITSAVGIVDQAITDLQDLDMQEYIDLAEDLISEFDSGVFDAINDTLAEADDTIDSFDFSKYNDTLKDVESIIEDLEEYFPDVLITCHNLYDFIYKPDGMKRHFDFFSDSNLHQLIDESGPGGMVHSVLLRIDEIGEIFREMFINYTTLDRFHAAKEGLDFTRTFNKVSGHPRSGYGDIYRHGSLYFLTQLYNESAKRTIEAHDPIAHGVYEGSDGKIYDQEDQKHICSGLGKALFGKECFQLCVTKECFIATKEDLEQEPIVEGSAVDTSFEALVGYVWIPPFIAVFFGLLTLLCPLMTSKPWARKAPATCMLCCVICQLGPILLLSGLFFPFVILAADTCNASDSLLQGLVKAYGDDICADMDGTGGLHSCTFDTYNMSFTVNPYAAVSGVLGDCSDGSDGGPYASPLRQIAAEFRSKAREQVDRKIHGEYYEDLEIKRLNQNLENIALDAVENVANVAALFLEDIGSEVVPCSKVSDIKEELIYPYCTSTIGALGWYLGCIYLMAWSLCCLGIPAGCCVQYENEQRAKEYEAYEKAFGGNGDEDEINDGEGSLEEADNDIHDKRGVRIPADDDEDEGGAYGAVFGGGRRIIPSDEQDPSAPPLAVVVHGDSYHGDYEMVEAEQLM